MRKHLVRLVSLGIISTLLLSQPVHLYATQGFTENVGATWIALNSNNGSNYLMHNAADGNNLEFAAGTGGTMKWQVLSISKTGNVGIGTNSAQALLHVAGDPRIQRPGGSALIIQTPASDVRMYGSGGKPFLIPEGNVGIGTYMPTKKLSVNGTVLAKEVIVSTNGAYWPDYVFEDGYQLMSLSNLSRFIEKNNHLPNVPSQKEVEEQGIPLGEMQRLHMEKIEELTLHLIEKDKEIQNLNSRLEKLESLIVK